MGSASINRFEWQKAVLKSDLLARAKIVAAALALEFFNEKTGQLNPGTERLAEATGSTLDTVKRGIRDLVKAGWLGRTEGRGRGNKTSYQLCSPGQIIPLTRPKKGASVPQKKGGTRAPLDEEKGAPVRGKGGTRALSYIEQSFEQKGAAREIAEDWRFSGRNLPGPETVFAREQHKLEDWGRFIKDRGLGALASIPLKRIGSKGEVGYQLPWRDVPDDPDMQREAIDYFTSLLETLEVRHAAQ